MKTINNRYATRRGEPMCSPRYPHTVAMEGRHIGLPLRWMNAVGRYIGLLGIHIGLPLLFLAACTQDDIAPAYNDAPLTITATIPGDVWAVATRAEGEGTVTYSDWTLHYTDYNGNPASGTLTATSSQDGTYTLTSGSDLVWAKVQDTQDADETFHLTCVGSDGATYYATTTAAHGALTVAFTTAMKPTLAKLTVNFTLSHNMAQVDYSDFTISVTAKAAKTSTADEVVYYPMTHGGTWPVAEGDAATTAFTLSQQSAATGTYTITGSMLLPQQTMGETMTVEYNNGTVNNFEDDISWTLDLSAVAVTGGEEGQKANELIAGQHLTLNLKAGLTAINMPSDIQIEAFTAADADSYNPDLGGVAKTYEYDAANNTYYIYHEKCIEAALADRAANHPEAAVVSKAATLAVVNGAEADLATMQAAIAGKTTIYVMGTELAKYIDGTLGDETQTVVGEAIRTSKAANGTISLVMPEVTTIGDYAFRYCYALTNVSLPKATTIGNSAFYWCIYLASVSLPKATTIGDYAFYRCIYLASVSLPEATEIGKEAFSSSALTCVSAPKATMIGEYAFSYCTDLTNVSLPAATSIGDAAFWSCYALTSLTFGSVIESVGTAAFKEFPTENCDLTLAAGQASHATYPAEEGENKRWAYYTWKSITLK
ncbi:MAG: leucine-rich repeat domain-containing protein [Bacteroidaceae bacterium]|nr:leucine-rich repeat domain-containing protein [Bacteroidaceae bacterium]